MEQRDFTKNFKNSAKVDHEGGDFIEYEGGESVVNDGDFEKNSIEENDERNSP